MTQADIAQADTPHAPDAHGESHVHPPHLAHHYDTSQQQFEASKLGMWIFLATEALMFSGLFCAYAVYRARHPEVFLYAHHYLDVTWGAINTAILLLSSFTMTWAVRAAQLGQRRLLVTLLGFTLIGATVFMGIKASEWTTKIEHNLAPGIWNVFNPVTNSKELGADLPHLQSMYDLGEARGEAGEKAGINTKPAGQQSEQPTGLNPGQSVSQANSRMATAAAKAARLRGKPINETAPAPPDLPVPHSLIAPARVGPTAIKAAMVADESVQAAPQGVYDFDSLSAKAKERVHLFFDIYFLMTGLHGIHVFVGMGLIGYITVRSLLNDFGPAYFTPVEIVGLYWHLVDLVWVFLFPLLYLIH